MSELVLAISIWCAHLAQADLDHPKVNSYCKEYVTECLYDEGVENLGYCMQDYVNKGREDEYRGSNNN